MTKDEVIKSIKSGLSLKEFKAFNDDVDVVKEAIKVDWKNIKFASENLKNNRTIALLAVGQSENAIKQLSEAMQNDPDVLIKVFDVSHKIAFVNPDHLKDIDYLKGVLKVGSGEHKIIEMLNDEQLENFAAVIYPYLRKALDKINYAYSDGFSVRSLMYKIPFVKGIERANLEIDFDSRMNGDIDLLNTDQLYALVVLTRYNPRLDRKRILDRIVATDNILVVEWLVKNKLIDDKELKLLTEKGISSKSAKINAYLMLKQSKQEESPRDNLLFHLLSEEAIFKEEGYKTLLNNIFDYENDEAVLLAFIKSNPPAHYLQVVLSSISEALGSSKTFISTIVRLDPNYMQYAQEQLKKDPKFIKKVLESGQRQNNRTQLLRYINPELLNDDAFVDELMAIDKDAIQYANPRMFDSKDRVLQLLRGSPNLYMVLSDALKADPEIAQLAIESYGHLFKELPVEMRNNKMLFKLALAKLHRVEDLLRFAGEEIRNDKELVLLNIKGCSEALQSAPEEFKDDKDIVLAALRINQINGRHVFTEYDQKVSELEREYEYFYQSNTTRIEQEKALKEYQQTQEAVVLEYAGEGLRSNPEFMKPLIEHNPFLYRFVTGELRNDPKLIDMVLKAEPFCIKYVPSTYFSSLNGSAKSYYKKFMDPNVKSVNDTIGFESLDTFVASQSSDNEKLAKMVASDPYQFKSLPEDKKKDRDLLEAIIELNPHAVHSMWGIPESLYLKAIELDASVVEDLYKTMKHNEEFILKAIKRNVGVMEYALKSMKNKKSFVIEAVNKNGECLGYVDGKFQSDESIVLAAVRQNPSAFQYASNDLLMKKEVAEIIYATLERADYPGLKGSRPLVAPFQYIRNETPGEKPANFGKKWAPTDLQTLIDEYNAGVELDYIAKKIGRDILACLVKLSENKIIDDKTIEDLEKKYDVPVELNILLETLGKRTQI